MSPDPYRQERRGQLQRELADEIARYDPALPIARASTPPSSWYLDPRFFALEQATVFRSSWLYAGRAAHLAAPGSYLPGCIAGEPFVLTRDDAGTLRGFYNVCRHHAAILVAEARGPGRADALTCPYHGWSYHLDGRLRKAPQLGAIEDFDVASYGLVPLRAGQWRDFALIHLGTPTQEPATWLAELNHRLDAMDPRPLDHVAQLTYDIRCNWKVFVDNYLDGGYHVPYAHLGLDSQLDMKSYRTELFDGYSIQSCLGGGSAAAAAIDSDGLAGRIGERALYAWLYPNFMINRYGPVMDTNLVIPLAHDRTRVVLDFFFADADTPAMKRFIANSLESSDNTQREDVALCESVQRGLQSSAYDRGRLAPGQEIGEHHFHRLLARDLGAADSRAY